MMMFFKKIWSEAFSGIGNIWSVSDKKAYSSLSPDGNVLGISDARRVQIWQC